MKTLFTTLVVALLLAIAPAVAQQADEYQGLVAEGIAEFGQGNWEESLLLFARAHELKPNARTFRGMGMAAYEARQYVRAIVNLQSALSDTRRPLSEGQRTEVEGLIAKSERFVARIAPKVTPEGAEIRVDSREPVLDQSGLLLVDRGDHEVVVRAAGHQPVVRRMLMRAGETQALEVKLVPVGQPGVAAATAPGSGDGATATAGQAREPDLLGVYIAGGAAVALAGAAVAFYLVADGKAQDEADGCAGECLPDEFDDRIDAAGVPTMQALSLVSWVGAGAAAATAGVLFYLEAGNPETPDSAGLRLRVAPTSVQLHGHF